MRTIFRAVLLVLELIAWYCLGLWVRTFNRHVREDPEAGRYHQCDECGTWVP